MAVESVPHEVVEQIRSLTGATAVTRLELVQSLWSGYGQLLRCHLKGSSAPSVIAKWICPPSVAQHPRGWHGTHAHQRKLRSYTVERTFYRKYVRHQTGARVARALFTPSCPKGTVPLLVLEDLDASGYPRRFGDSPLQDAQASLSWLAQFHAQWLGTTPDGLWSVGTYWHLDTRPEELSAMPPGELQRAAESLDRRLNAAEYRTLVHGDAKVANFCYPALASPPSPGTASFPQGSRGTVRGSPAAAAVDFQYVGGGVGIKDVAYLLGSCLSSEQCERHAPKLLDDYFAQLAVALREAHPEVDPSKVEREWRSLYPLAWADFQRFLLGWAPGHYKLNAYCQRMTRLALESLAG